MERLVSLSLTDYYPFGAALPGRQFSANAYRFGFNGMERDNDINGSQSVYDFGARVYDGRIGRWFSTDAYENRYPGYSPYSYALNCPISANDPSGDTVTVTVTAKRVGFTQINLYSSSEIREDASRANEKMWVPVYEVNVTNESGSENTFYFTRIGFRGDASNSAISDVSFDVRSNGDEFSGKVRSRWRGTNNVLELRAFDDNTEQTVEGMRNIKWDSRTAIQFHVKGATDGCLLCAGEKQIFFSPSNVTLDTDDLGKYSTQSQRNFMDAIINQRDEDIEAGNNGFIKIKFDRIMGTDEYKDQGYSSSYLNDDDQE